MSETGAGSNGFGSKASRSSLHSSSRLNSRARPVRASHSRAVVAQQPDTTSDRPAGRGASRKTDYRTFPHGKKKTKSKKSLKIQRKALKQRHKSSSSSGAASSASASVSSARRLRSVASHKVSLSQTLHVTPVTLLSHSNGSRPLLRSTQMGHGPVLRHSAVKRRPAATSQLAELLTIQRLHGDKPNSPTGTTGGGSGGGTASHRSYAWTSTRPGSTSPPSDRDTRRSPSVRPQRSLDRSTQTPRVSPPRLALGLVANHSHVTLTGGSMDDMAVTGTAVTPHSTVLQSHHTAALRESPHVVFNFTKQAWENTLQPPRGVVRGSQQTSGSSTGSGGGGSQSHDPALASTTTTPSQSVSSIDSAQLEEVERAVRQGDMELRRMGILPREDTATVPHLQLGNLTNHGADSPTKLDDTTQTWLTSGTSPFPTHVGTSPMETKDTLRVEEVDADSRKHTRSPGRRRRHRSRSRPKKPLPGAPGSPDHRRTSRGHRSPIATKFSGQVPPRLYKVDAAHMMSPRSLDGQSLSESGLSSPDRSRSSRIGSSNTAFNQLSLTARSDRSTFSMSSMTSEERERSLSARGMVSEWGHR